MDLEESRDQGNEEYKQQVQTLLSQKQSLQDQMRTTENSLSKSKQECEQHILIANQNQEKITALEQKVKKKNDSHQQQVQKFELSEKNFRVELEKMKQKLEQEK